MPIPQEIIDAVLNRTDIVILIQKYIPLKKAGNNYLGLCPFHQEKTPSFTVNQQKKFFYCFGCHAKGNTIGFIQQYLGLDFPAAIEELAIPAGIEMPKYKPANSKTTAYYEIMDQALTFYKKQLATHTTANDYLKKREFSEKDIKTYQLGYAPTKDKLRQHLVKLGCKASDLKQLGLVSGNQGQYDFFQERIIFPIFNRKGQAIGFGGRIINEGDKYAKYLNSPDTPIYSKKHELYCYHLLDRSFSIVVVVEGYFDTLSLLKHGVKNVVAVLGTALGQQQIDLLRNSYKTVIFFFDGDKAGMNAMARTLRLLLPTVTAHNEFKFLTQKTNSDPDDFIKQNGLSGFKKEVVNAYNLAQTIALVAQNESKQKTNDPVARRAHELTILSELSVQINDRALAISIREALEKIYNLPFELSTNYVEQIKKFNNSNCKTIIYCLYYCIELVMCFDNPDYLPIEKQEDERDLALLKQFIELLQEHPGATTKQINDILTSNQESFYDQVLEIIIEMEQLELQRDALLTQFEDVISFWMSKNRNNKMARITLSINDNQNTDILKKSIYNEQIKKFKIDQGLRQQLLDS